MNSREMVPGAHVVDTITNGEYQIDRVDNTRDVVHIYNWLIERRTVPITEFLNDFEISRLPSGIGNKQLQLDPNLCDHEYTQYHGLRESFVYCKKCDKKQ